MASSLIFGVAFALVALNPNVNGEINKGKISADVLTALQGGKSADIMVECGDSPESKRASTLIHETLEKVRTLLDSPTDSRRHGSESGKKLTEYVDLIQRTSTDAMQPVIDLCKNLEADFEVLWISRIVFVRSAWKHLVDALADLDVVLRIKLERKYPLILPKPPAPPMPFPSSPTTTTPRPEISGNSSWNLGLVDARCPDITCLGNGVRVGIIDGGALWNHTELKDSWLGDFGWWDGVEPTVSPFPIGEAHGTAVTGIIAGKTVGVAPASKWSMCRGCTDDGGCLDSALMMCAQFMACPWPWNDYTPGRIFKDCSKRPYVINNSWGGVGGSQTLDPSDDPYYKIIEMWNALGITSVFIVGEEGPGCATGAFPGNFDNTLAVGAVDASATIAYFSSRGPTSMTKLPNSNTISYSTCESHPLGNSICTSDDIRDKPLCLLRKPELVAPGVNVVSSWIGSVTDYESHSGTSFAAPHVTGVVALMICANPDLNWNHKLVSKVLTETADTSLIDLTGVAQSKGDMYAKSSNLLCNYLTSGICNEFPNNVYGYGLPYACKAVQTVKQM